MVPAPRGARERLEQRFGGAIIRPRRPRLRRGPHDLQRDDRPPPGADRPVPHRRTWSRRSASGREAGSRSPCAAAATASPAQALSEGGLVDRPAPHERRHRRPRRAHGASWAAAPRWRDLDRGHRALRAGHHRRAGVDDRRRRLHPRRRRRLARRASSGWPATTSSPPRSSPPTARCFARRRDRDPDLFWALHGGGGNFGVATSLTLRLHPLRPRDRGAAALGPEAGPRGPARLPRLHAEARTTRSAAAAHLSDRPERGLRPGGHPSAGSSARS